MVAALGPPPAEFLAKNPERRADFWDDEGMLEPWTLDVLRLYVLFLSNSRSYRQMAGSRAHPGGPDDGSPCHSLRSSSGLSRIH